MAVTYETLAALPLEQQVGQLLCIGVRGTELDADARALMAEVNPGGLIVFGRNVAAPEQLRALLDDFRAAAPAAPILGIDQEGGLVDRLRRVCRPMPAARKIREHGDLAGARALGRVTGEILRLFGFNLNFAPVMEIMNEERDLLSNGLYSRAFGRSPGEVMGYAMTYLRGLQKTGCWGCLKHFPGIGAGEIDSHEEIPVIRLAHEDLLAQDLAPYIELFARHEDMVRVVMISHGGFPDIDVRRGMAGGMLEPASLSRRIVTTLLREELGYQYLTVSDDLEMGAISRHCNIGEAACRSFSAGVDVLLICADPAKIRAGYQALLAAVKRGDISSDRLHEALRRIAEFKSVMQPPVPFSPVILSGLSDEIAALNTKLDYSYGGPKLMLIQRTAMLLFVVLLLAGGSLSCRKRSTAFVIGLSDKFSSLDPVVSKENAAANERIRQLMFNTLVKKNEKFDYVGELATEIQISPDGLTLTFPIREGVKFHNGKVLTSADCKYTFDYLLASESTKAASFFDTVVDPATGKGQKVGRIAEMLTPDPKTLVIRLRGTSDRQKVVSSLVAIGVVAENTGPQQATAPMGTGPFKFVSYDNAQMFLDVKGNPDYWEGAPSITDLRVKVVLDANSMQAELKSGRIDLVPLPSNMTPDTVASLATDPNLKVEKFAGANIVYVGFNVQQAPLNNVKLRQAIAYAINRELIIKDLLRDQATIANSILPEVSWAYAAGQKYSFDPARAKQILDEAGFKDPDGDGPQMRFSKPLEYKVSAGSPATRQYAEVIQSQLKTVGIPVEISTIDFNTLLDQLPKGQFQMTSSQWIGGNQDPIFLRDILASSEIPDDKRKGLNRSRYGNSELDKLLNEAMNTSDRTQAFTLYSAAQDIIARDVPMIPLWYRANMVIAQKRVGNIKVNAGGDWDFVRLLTVSK